MVNVQAQTDAVSRTLHIEDVDGVSSHVQTLSQEYPSGLADVWDAVTSAERIPRWFLPIDGDLVLGGHYQLHGNAGGEVLSCQPPVDGTASYRVTWEFGGGVSWLVIRLAEIGPERTRLELEHTARVGDLPPGFWDTYGPGATGVGWDGGLLGLALHLGTQDAALSPSEAQAWAMSEEGGAFYRACADAWAAAHIAAGGDPQAAASAADNTYRFYTGQPQEG